MKSRRKCQVGNRIHMFDTQVEEGNTDLEVGEADDKEVEEITQGGGRVGQKQEERAHERTSRVARCRGNHTGD